MNNKELRRAAEMAGLVIRHDPAWSWWAGQDDTPFSWEWRADDPALPAFIASRLVEKVRETFPFAVVDVTNDLFYECEIRDRLEHNHEPQFQAVFAESEILTTAIIRACMEVLGD